MTISEFIDGCILTLSNLWGAFTLVFYEPIGNWPLWAGVAYFVIVFGFWSISVNMAQEELQHPTEEQLTKQTFWDRPGIMLVPAAICFAVAVSSLAFDELPHFMGVWFLGTAYMFSRGYGIQKDWLRVKEYARQKRQRTEG